MRNQAFLLAASAAVIIGCGGGGSNGSSGTGSTSGSSAGGMNVALDSTFGRVEVNYLTGQGRAVGDTYVQITRQTITDASGTLLRDSTSPLEMRLNGYEVNTARIAVPFSGVADSRNFTELEFDPNSVLLETSSGRVAQTLPTNLPFTTEARIRVFPGRTTGVSLYVNDAHISEDALNPGSYLFNETDFTDNNYSVDEADPDGLGKLASRLTDFVRFNLAGLASGDRPDLRDEDGNVTGKAQYVYFSGDNYALSNSSSGGGSIFQQLTLDFDNPVIGKWQNGTGQFAGTYDLRTADPTQLPATARILALQGMFRDYTQVLTGGSSFELVMFPNSGETYSYENDPSSGFPRGRLGDLVAIVRNGTSITNMYYGGVNLEAGTFELYPISRLGGDPSDTDGLIEGTVSNYLDRNGAVTADVKRVRRLTYTFDSSASLPTGFASTGTITIFRN